MITNPFLDWWKNMKQEIDVDRGKVQILTYQGIAGAMRTRPKAAVEIILK